MNNVPDKSDSDENQVDATPKTNPGQIEPIVGDRRQSIEDGVPAKIDVSIPSLRWILAWGILIAGTCFLHFASGKIEDALPFVDQAVRNIVTAIVIVIVPLLVMIWLCFYSPYWTVKIRKLAFLLFLTLQIVGLVVFGMGVELDGNLSPVGYRFPWSPPPDNQLQAITGKSNATIDLKTESPVDFPQFMGPNRNGRLDGTFLAYDWEEDPPKLLWKQPIGAGHSGFSTRNGYAVTMEQRGDQELTVCYEIETGKLVWAHGETSRHTSPLGKTGPRSTPTIHNGLVYSLGAQGLLCCLDGSNGRLVWRRDLFQEFNTSISEDLKVVSWGRSASPLVYDDKVVVPAGGPSGARPVSLVAYHRLTGLEIWRGGNQQIGYASPILAPYFSPQGTTDVVISVNEANVSAHDKENGKEIWSVERPGSSTAGANTSQPIALPGSRFLLTKGYGLGGELIQIQGDQVHQVWKKNTVLKTKFTNAVQYQKHAFALSDGRLECVDLQNGKRIWKSRKSYGHGQLLLCGSELLILAEKGYVALVRAWGGPESNTAKEGHVQFTSFQAIEGVTWNTIAMHGDLMLVRNSQEAACYEMPLRFRSAKP